MGPKKYVYADIRIPLEVGDNYKFETLNDYASVTFSECEGKHVLRKTNGFDLNAKFREMMEKTMEPMDANVEDVLSDEETSDKEEPMVVLPEELNGNKKRSNNVSFKKRPKLHHNYTAKSRGTYGSPCDPLPSF